MIYYEVFAQFSWLKFAMIAALYSLLIFTSFTFKSGVVSSPQNETPRPKVLLVHLVFLVVLFAITWSAAAAYPHLAPRMTRQHLTNRYGWESSQFGVITSAAILVMAAIELTYFYRQTRRRRETPQ